MAERLRASTTIAGKMIVYNTFITGNENWQLRNTYIEYAKDPGKAALEAEKLGFRLVIVSIDGDTVGVDEQILALPLPEYNAIAALVKPITDGEEKKANRGAGVVLQ